MTIVDLKNLGKVKKYFNINFEFDQKVVDSIIMDHIANKKTGYVCSLDGNNLAVAQTNAEHLDIVNDSIVNNCDSSWIPVIINAIYHTDYSNYCGTDLFIYYIKMKKYRQFFLGSTQEVLSRLKENLSKIDPNIQNMVFETLPFRSVEDFDYKGIAKMINQDEPDIIWVSLGAPKQEKFMKLLLPYLNKGVMFGFGAIFNVYAKMPGLKRAPKLMVKLKLEWFYRLIQEPKKQFKRISLLFKLLPYLIKSEFKNRQDKRSI
jgi:N-acetylglucosaminyldiphosphoundecaprenol N-acetyl-beta-D-mannosaminyltransferase